MDKDMITMSRKETKRLHIIHQALEKRITQAKAAELVGVSNRQLRRMIKEKVQKPLLIDRRYQSPDHPWKRLRRASQQLPVAS